MTCRTDPSLGRKGGNDRLPAGVVLRRKLRVCTLEGEMDKNRIKGSATNMGGKAKEAAGKATGDSKLQGEGKMDQAKGKVRNAAGGITDALKK
jgi:uncharacterized protein YjbJ (UPF0337 family)